MEASKTVCIYCGANNGNSQDIIDQSTILCEDLARSGFDLVYGGGKDGLMKIVADIFLAHNRKVTGIRPEKLIADEALHEGVTKMITVKDMYIRKAQMIEHADVLLALPGGIGTMDEIMDAFTEIKLGFIDKDLFIFNPNNYYSGLKALLENMVKHDFLKPQAAALLNIYGSSSKLFNQIDSKFSTKKEIDKVALISIDDKKILTCLSKGKSSFYIPGGKREIGESDEQTLIREIDEELSVDILPSTIKYVGTYRAQADGNPIGTNVKMTCYSASYKGTVKAANEIQQVKWMSYKNRDEVSHVDKVIFDDFKLKNMM